LSILTREFQTPRAKKMPESKNSTRAFPKFYPTGAVQVDLPFPFGKRRMTVAAESDFQ
jgi:hypothetical protein